MGFASCYCYCTRSSDRPCGPGSSAAPEEEDRCCMVRRSYSRCAPSASAPLAPLRARSNSSPREIMVFGDGGNRLGDSSMGFGLDLPASACRPAIYRPRDKAALLAGSSEFGSGLACRRAACARGVDANGLAGFGVLFPFWPPSSQLFKIGENGQILRSCFRPCSFVSDSDCIRNRSS